MGVGRTNAVVGGGGGTAFLAYIQIATDANAEITAVNLAGDTFSGTADSTGALTLTVNQPGTYTVTETNGGVESIAVADNGVTYQITVVGFEGNVIVDGIALVGMEALAWQTQNYSGVIPTVTSNTQSGDAVISVTITNGSGVYITEKAYNLSDFTEIVCKGIKNGNTMIVLIEEDAVSGVAPITQYNILYSGYQEMTTLLTNSYSYDSSKKYKIGVWVQGSTYNIANINKLILR